MFNKFLISLRESLFIEGMAKIFDFRGVIERKIVPALTDAEALADDWNKVLGDYKHSIILIEEDGNAAEISSRG